MFKTQEIQGAKAIICSSNDNSKYLLAQHNIKDPLIAGKWTFLGGWKDKNDKSLQDTLKRELKEELDLLVEIEKEIGVFEYRDKKRLYIIFLAKALGEPNISCEEILNFDWFTYPQILEMDKKSLLQTGFEISAFTKLFKVL